MSATYQRGRAWVVTVLLFLFVVVNFLDKISVGLLAGPMMDELGLTPSQFGLVGSSFFWLFAVAGVAGGFVANRVSCTLLLLLMAIAWSVFQLPLAWSSSLAVLIAARVLLGIAEGPSTAIAIHAAYKWFPDDRRTLPVAFFTQGGATGLILAGITIPYITAHWGWRANFYVLAALGAAWTVLWLLFGGEGKVDQVSADTAGQPRVPYRALLGDATVLGCFLLRFVAYWSLALSLTWFAAYLQRGLGFDHATSGRLFAAIIAANMPVTLGVAWWSQRMLRRGMPSRIARGRLAALMLVGAGLCLAALLSPGLVTWQRVALLAASCALAPSIYSLGPAMLAEVCPPAQRGALLSIDASISSIAGILAPLVTGYLVQNATGAHGYETGFAVCGALMIVGGFAGAAMINPERSKLRMAGLQQHASAAPAAHPAHA